MLFNSYVFIFAFFPIVFLGYFHIGKSNHALASLWLAATSLFFYGWWDVRYVILLLCSVVFNYGAGYLIACRSSAFNQQVSMSAKLLLAGAVGVNLLLLGYFKYSNFFFNNLNYFLSTHLSLGEVILPLGISFFSFTQIAFLVDTYQGKVKEFNFIHYLLFVTYFPHLIAGPVLHHKEMMPQFAKHNVCTINWNNVTVGLSIFVLGLAKKVLIADCLAEFATPVFNLAAAGGNPALIEAWIGALAYTLQLYFDFSAYSDMAIGLSLTFNVRLPMNFNSPYKATNIIDFWRRWHMTLSRFLRDYLYIPLGGSRNGKASRYLNLMTTMLLGGLWHGAGWTFVIWGGLHGFYLIVNHAWRWLKELLAWGDSGNFTKLGAGALTFLAVVVGWVFFRSNSFSAAIAMLHGMAGMNGMSLPPSIESMLGQYFSLQNLKNHSDISPLSPISYFYSIAMISVGFLIVWLFPNLQQLFYKYRPVCTSLADEDTNKWNVEFTPRTKVFLGFSFGITTALCLIFVSADSPFLYFQF